MALVDAVHIASPLAHYWVGWSGVTRAVHWTLWQNLWQLHIQVLSRLCHYDSYMDRYYNKIRYHIAKVQVTTSPFRRVQSSDCTMWHKLPKNAAKAEKSSLTVLCGMCKRLRSELDRALQRCTGYSPHRKVKRQQPSSNYPLKYMSPASLKRRKSNTQQERNKNRKAFSKV